MKTIKKLWSSVLLLLLILSFLFPTPAFAQTRPWEEIAPGRCTFTVLEGSAAGQNVATLRGVECLIANILSIAVTIIGLAGFVMLLYGSFMYLISGGNSKGTESARNTMTMAIFGLVIALSAIFVLNIIAAFTGISVINSFRIPEF